MLCREVLPLFFYVYFSGLITHHGALGHGQFLCESTDVLVGKQCFNLLIGIFFGMFLHVKELHPFLF